MLFGVDSNRLIFPFFYIYSLHVTQKSNEQIDVVFARIVFFH